MRAMYKSVGVKSYPLAKGVSLDMEAYCTNLADYKKNSQNILLNLQSSFQTKKRAFYLKYQAFLNPNLILL